MSVEVMQEARLAICLCISRSSSVSTVKAGSNTDLGLMRSLAVVKELLKIQQQNKMPGVQFRAY
jgi:hypothetical protein